MNKVFFVMIATLFFVDAQASNIPSSINMVKTFRYEDDIIRIIKNNMEIKPEIEIEKFSTPDYKLIDNVVIDHVEVDGNRLGFQNISGVFVESIGLVEDDIKFVLDYYFLHGRSETIVCNLPIGSVGFGEPHCSFSN
ncbi:hypothetical protein A3K86_03580 [Photobacterium jeanii]|uniref:Uncharacterized protein n=1 Tax=Photobacterium jeanii TaxID=858640 RepID=A0A178KMW2_9GAMM|nr:hypothetical protein [Photobacterium jeanii]OAN18013.1 hypothetical protein A3K86_03580 [Photobacterium jeanii]PST92318.1 hypothetical protein C9I91_03860 [Photobacterium jeanii]